MSEVKLRWVKASERLPEFVTTFPLKVYERCGFGKFYKEHERTCLGFEAMNGFGTLEELHFENVEWLEEYTEAADDGYDEKCYHECPQCNSRCNCPDIPCSCCESKEWEQRVEEAADANYPYEDGSMLFNQRQRFKRIGFKAGAAHEHNQLSTNKESKEFAKVMLALAYMYLHADDSEEMAEKILMDYNILDNQKLVNSDILDRFINKSKK